MCYINYIKISIRDGEKETQNCFNYTISITRINTHTYIHPRSRKAKKNQEDDEEELGVERL